MSQNSQILITNLAHVSRSLHTAFDNFLKDTGITAARGRVLLFLLKYPEGAMQAQVTSFLRVEHPTAVRILDGLEDQGMIKRLPSHHDRRAKVIVLTDEGKPVAQHIAEASSQFIDRVTRGLQADEIAAGIRLGEKLLANIQELSAADDASGDKVAS